VRIASALCTAQADGSTAVDSVIVGSNAQCVCAVLSTAGQSAMKSGVATDHICLHLKLTDIGWPTKIVLPSIRNHMVLKRWRDNADPAPNICTNSCNESSGIRSVIQPTTNCTYVIKSTNVYV
jgi:hypothetical protein